MSKKLTYFQWQALKDCSTFPDGAYVWKQQTMKKLSELGYVVGSKTNLDNAYTLTQKGREAVRKNPHGDLEETLDKALPHV